MANAVDDELQKLNNLYRVKQDLESLPQYIRFHAQTVRHFKDLVDETVMSLARCVDQRLPGSSQDGLIEQVLDLRRRWIGSGALEFLASSRCMVLLDGIITNELRRLSKCNWETGYVEDKTRVILAAYNSLQALCASFRF